MRNLEGFGSVDPATIKLNAVTGNADVAPVGGLGGVPGIGQVGGGSSALSVSSLEPLAPAGDYRPLVTYISRQNSRRHLTDDSHEGLVKALKKRSEQVGFELVIVAAETLSKEEQIALAARTTVSLHSCLSKSKNPEHETRVGCDMRHRR